MILRGLGLCAPFILLYFRFRLQEGCTEFNYCLQPKRYLILIIPFEKLLPQTSSSILHSQSPIRANLNLCNCVYLICGDPTITSAQLNCLSPYPQSLSDMLPINIDESSEYLATSWPVFSQYTFAARKWHTCVKAPISCGEYYCSFRTHPSYSLLCNSPCRYQA